jgi:hypothetical protein
MEWESMEQILHCDGLGEEVKKGERMTRVLGWTRTLQELQMED